MAHPLGSEVDSQPPGFAWSPGRVHRRVALGHVVVPVLLEPRLERRAVSGSARRIRECAAEHPTGARCEVNLDPLVIVDSRGAPPPEPSARRREGRIAGALGWLEPCRQSDVIRLDGSLQVTDQPTDALGERRIAADSSSLPLEPAARRPPLLQTVENLWGWRALTDSFDEVAQATA